MKGITLNAIHGDVLRRGMTEKHFHSLSALKFKSSKITNACTGYCLISGENDATVELEVSLEPNEIRSTSSGKKVAILEMSGTELEALYAQTCIDNELLHLKREVHVGEVDLTLERLIVAIQNSNNLESLKAIVKGMSEQPPAAVPTLLETETI